MIGPARSLSQKLIGRRLAGEGGGLVVDARGYGLGHATRGIGRVIVETLGGLARLGVAAEVLGPPELAPHLGGKLSLFLAPSRAWRGILSPGTISREAVVVRLAPTAPGPLDRRSVVVCYDLIQLRAAHEHFALHRRARYPLIRHAYLHSLDLIRRAGQVWAISRSVAADVVQMLGVDPARVTAIPLARPAWASVRSEALIAAARARFALPPGFILWVLGGTNANKNVEGMLRAVAAVAGLPELVIAGGLEGRSRNHVERVARAAGVSPRFLGRVPDDDLAALMRAASCVAVPSRDEGFGMPMVEALACGGVVVANDIPVLRELATPAVVYGNAAVPAEFGATLLAASRGPRPEAEPPSRTWDDVGRELLALVERI